MKSLTDLISEAKDKLAKEAEAKSLATKAKSAKTEDARRASQLEADRIRAELDWQPRALVLVIDNWECSHCETEGESPTGIFILKEHVRLANSVILEPPRSESRLPDDLPRRRKYTNRVVAICPHCAADVGFAKILTDKVNEIKGQTTTPAQHGPFVRDWLVKRSPTGDA